MKAKFGDKVILIDRKWNYTELVGRIEGKICLPSESWGLHYLDTDNDPIGI